VRREGRRKKQCLPFFWQESENLFQLGGKPHVEHPVRFIENKHAQFLQTDGLPLKVIDEAPGGCDNHMVSLGECTKLRLHGDPANQAHDAKGRSVKAELPENIRHLGGELTGGNKDEHRLIGLFQKLGKDRDGKGWIGVGVVKFMPAMARSSDFGKFSS